MNRARVLAAAGGAVLLAAAACVGWLSLSRPAAAPASRQATAQVAGRVELGPGLSPSALPAGAQIVVYAYALDGPRVPLAVFRRPASSLPLEFALTDDLAPNPAFRISQAPRLVVGARLGMGEAASPQPDDWIATSQTVAANERAVRLVLQARQP